MATIFAILLPNIGLLGSIAFTALWWEITELYHSPEWALHNRPKIYIPLVVGVNLCVGFSSILVSKRGFWAATIPLGVYAVQLGLYWAHFPILYALSSPRWGFVDMALTTITAAVAAILFWDVNRAAGCLTVPNLFYLAYNTYYDYWVYRTTTRLKSKPKAAVKKQAASKADDRNPKE